MPDVAGWQPLPGERRTQAFGGDGGGPGAARTPQALLGLVDVSPCGLPITLCVCCEDVVVSVVVRTTGINLPPRPLFVFAEPYRRRL